jgi:hypothetical protein
MEINLQDLLTRLSNVAQAINNLQQTVAKVFPIGTTVTTTATGGAATLPANPAKFLTITLPDGTTGKVPVYNL